MKLILFLGIVATLASSQPAASEPAPDRQAVVAGLKHHEDLVKSLQVDYEHVMLPTPPNQALLIRRALGKRAEANIRTPEFTKHYTGTARFWRKGAKQREEWSPLDPSASSSKRAFDGQILRSLADQGSDGRPVASIASADTGDWYRMPREDPMAFMYLYYEQPLSEVVASASRFSSALITGTNDRLYRVSLDGLPGGHVLEFLLDQRFLQRERIIKIRYRKDQSPTYNHKLVFSGYREYETDSGEKIWFPEKVSYTGYSMEGTAPDGSPLEALWEEYHFRKVQFNIDMPDSLFELEIPKNARIADRLTGAGWLPEGERPALLFPREAQGRRFWVAAVVLTALVVVAVGVFLSRKYRRPQSA